MGQKLNPTIFRLGVNKTWKTEFFEKKNHELPLYVFKDLEIKNFINRIFETSGILVHDYKQHYNASTLNLYISYFITSDFVVNNKKNNEQLIIKSSLKNRNVRKTVATREPFSCLISLNEAVTLSLKDASRFYKIKQYLNSSLYAQQLKHSLFENLPDAQNFKFLNQLPRNQELDKKTYLGKVSAVLNLFFSSQLNIVINFCCINKNVHFLKHAKTLPFISFQKFKNTPFFKEGIELLFNVTHNKNSANLLAKFIAFQIKKIRRHKFFLSFLKQTLHILMNSSLAKIKGIKIIVKGRLNGVSRAKHKMIIIGDVPVQTMEADLDYSQTTSHNSNGSYGIKVWIVEK